MDKSFYFQAQKNYILDLMKYVFDVDAFDSTDLHDECPSITLTISLEHFHVDTPLYYKVYLPSDYEGDYSEFIIMQLDYPTQDGAEGTFIDGLPNLAEVVKFFKNII